MVAWGQSFFPRGGIIPCAAISLLARTCDRPGPPLPSLMSPSLRYLTVTSVVTLAAVMSSRGEPQSFSSAETRSTLLELYSSEGCSSCPPAEEWIGRLKLSAELWKTIVPVVFHVDYWDGLGWPDRFASPEFTARQRRYAAAWGSNSVYTPGFVAAGRVWKGFFQRESLPATSPEKTGRLSVTLRDLSRAEVSYHPTKAAPNTLRVWVALLGSDLASEVKRGENRGRTLRHEFVVLRLQSAPLTFADGHWTAALTLPAISTDTPRAVAAWVAAGEAQPPLQATGGWLR